MNFTSKEQVLHFMNKGVIKMSTQDASFFQSIYGLLYRNKKITSNQDQLFNKLLVKHKAQLKRKGIIASPLCDLPWTKIQIIDSQEQFTKANLKLVDGVLYLRTPFNQKFISELHLTYSKYSWNSGNRNYSAPFSTIALKIAVRLVEKHFKSITLCPVLAEIIKQVPTIENAIWRPTLVKGKTGYYIAALNDVLASKIQDIELNADPLTFFQLSKLGINVSSELIGEDKFAKFAALHHNILSVNSTLDIRPTIIELANWLSRLNISKVVIGKVPNWVRDRKTIFSVKQIFNEQNIVCVPYTEHSPNEEAVVINFVEHLKVHTPNVVKRIMIKESAPIKV